MRRLTICSQRVALPDGLRPASVHVEDDRIAGLGRYHERPAGTPVLDAGELVVLPGIVDTHVHVNEPGRTDWEGFAHATRAAAAGGVTTIVDMPLNSIPATISVAGLEAKRAAASGQCYVDVGFWGGVVPGNAAELAPLSGAGVLGFKCFLSPSGVDEFPNVGEEDLREAMPILTRLGAPLLAHAEDPSSLRDATTLDAARADPRKYATWLGSRPSLAECAAIERLIRLAREFGTRVHIVHLAAADALPLLAAARHEGIALSVETCPHYLTFAAEEIADGQTAFKCAPPIRERDQRERLWTALAVGHIDLIATDHSPAPASTKHVADGDFLRAWGGIASLQVGLAAVWTGMSDRELPVDRISTWLAANPAALAGLAGTKGTIAPGCDADFVVWDPDASAVVDGARLYHRHPMTPYDGLRLRGVVKTTMLRGEVVFRDGECCGEATGRLLASRRTAASRPLRPPT